MTCFDLVCAFLSIISGPDLPIHPVLQNYKFHMKTELDEIREVSIEASSIGKRIGTRSEESCLIKVAQDLSFLRVLI